MKLDRDSIEWAIDSLDKYGDTDLFPKPVELKIIKELGDDAIDLIADIDISNHEPGAPRRFVVPKDDLSVRPATQLDPLDSIIFTAIMYEFGKGIEDRRSPVSDSTVFSYRFDTSADGDLYSSNDAWNEFWNQGISLASQHKYALIVDISDFYNQIYHHTVENELIAAGFPNQVKKWVQNLFQTVSSKVSRGVPVGPHASHLIAESSLIPIDNSLSTRGIKYCRFVDDFVVFTDDKSVARKHLYEIAEILDKQQRLQLQKSKTKILASSDFIKHAREMIEDRPINDIEDHILSIIRRHSNGNPYKSILFSELSEDELKEFNSEAIEKILSDYLSSDEPDYIRLRWFLRRLTQVGHEAAVNFCLENFEDMIPAITEIARYFVAVSSKEVQLDWKDIGGKLLELLDNDVVKSNEYFQISILSLFGNEPELNHINRLVEIYKTASSFLKRKIIIAAAESKKGDWLRELKEGAPAMDPWQKRAYLFATNQLQAEERKFLIRHITDQDNPLEKLIADWAK